MSQTIDLDRLLAPGTGGDPENEAAWLEFDEAYADAVAKLDAREPAGEAYRTVLRLGEQLLGVGKHLEVVVRMAEAATHAHGFPGLLASLRLADGLVERYWSGGESGDGTGDDGATNLLPALFEPDEPGDPPDPMARNNRLLALRDPERMGRAIRAAALATSRAEGEVPLRLALAADGQLALTGDEEAPAQDVIQSALRAAAEENPEGVAANLEAAREARATLKSLQERLDELSQNTAPDLAPLDDWIRPAEGYLAPFVGGGESAGDDPAGGDPAQQADGGRSGGGGTPGVGRITSRADAEKAIHDLVRWFETYDPSSPVRELLLYASHLVNMHFLEWQEELAADDRLMERLRQIRNPDAAGE